MKDIQDVPPIEPFEKALLFVYLVAHRTNGDALVRALARIAFNGRVTMALDALNEATAMGLLSRSDDGAYGLS